MSSLFAQSNAGENQEVRLDKWLWAVRIFKTRSLAAAACRKGAVLIGEVPAKPSREVRIGDLIKAEVGEIKRTYKVRGLVQQRVSATLAREAVEDLTPPAELEKLKQAVLPSAFFRPKGTGRPTKKDRRQMESEKEQADGQFGALP